MLDPFISYKKEIQSYLQGMDLQNPFEGKNYFR